MICDRVGCGNEAKYNVRIQIRSHPYRGYRGAAISDPVVHVCEDHKDVQWQDVVTPDGWVAILKEFHRMGKAEPKRKYSDIVVEPIDGS